MSRFELVLNWFSVGALPTFYLLAYPGLYFVEELLGHSSDSTFSVILQMSAALAFLGGPIAIACVSMQNYSQKRIAWMLSQFVVIIGWCAFLIYQIGLVPCMILASLGFVFGLWWLWSLLCFQGWIEMWADSESLRLKSYKVFFIHRGPFWSLPFSPRL
ncbi:hypothetical protein N9Y42_09005 [Mariniblastus sp.]|nr:hypothetical protein [Mariniblastus sp.]